MKKRFKRLAGVVLTSALLAASMAGNPAALALESDTAGQAQSAAVTQAVYAPGAPIALSVKNGDLLKGTRTVQAETYNPADQIAISIDGSPVPAIQVLPASPELVMEVDGFDTGYKNGILIGDQIVKVFDANIKGYQTVKVPIPTPLLQKGANTISLHSGNNKSPTGTEGNNDDFSVRNVRLALSDGTVLPVEDIKVKIGDGSVVNVNPADRITLRDGLPPNDLTARESAAFLFTIPNDRFLAKLYSWDTTTAADGKHAVSADAQGPNGNKRISAEVIVDNTKPIFESISPIEGKTYKGDIDFTVQAADATSGIDKVEAKLDGKPIALPSRIAGVDLAPGLHQFEVAATDKAGNKATASVSFGVVEEHPYKPENPDPEDGSGKQSINPKLSVQVVDPTGDPMDVTFYKGYRADMTNTANKAFVHAADREPPLELNPAGQQLFTEEAYEAVRKKDGNYFTTDDTEAFPYHRFDLKLENDLTDVEHVEVVWQGHSLPGRQVTLYTWNHNTQQWVAGASGMGEQDFTLRASVNVADMVKDGVINVLVQDLIPSPDEFDFTFAWVTDTQYYSERYPNIYDAMSQYIVENRDAEKIDYVIHTGDIVDDWDQPHQWANADKSMKILDDAGVPYGVVSGNHDVNFNKADYAEYWKYFGKDRFKDRPYYGGELDNNRDHYDLISSKGNDFIILYLGWSIDQQTIDWANEVLRKYPDRNAIVATHEYISPNGNYSGQGQEIWSKIVAKNQNVFMVLCGHHHGVAYNVKHAEDGRTVIEMLSDYQAGPEGGQGYLRLLHFDTENKQLIVNTYSPYMKDYNFFDENGKDEFSLPLTLKPIQKRVATDYIAVNMYGKEAIGQDTGVRSGTEAKTHWHKLDKDNSYYWYVRLSDRFGGRARSDLWGFETK